jgi:cytochrome bd-type quinol oxidase subunit 1
MMLDPILLSRLQWTWVIAWHILLPGFTVGLASGVARPPVQAEWLAGSRDRQW